MPVNAQDGDVELAASRGVSAPRPEPSGERHSGGSHGKDAPNGEDKLGLSGDAGDKSGTAAGEDGAAAADPLGWFGKLLSVIVAAAMAAGTLLGYYAPESGRALASASVAQINIPIAVLIWVMVFPMMLHIDFAAVGTALRNGKAIFVTSFVNYAIQPFAMYGLAAAFIWGAFGSIISKERQDEYVAGSVILGGAPCTAMVFVWSALVHGHAGYTLTQVAVNNLIMLVAYVPTTGLLISSTSVTMPWDTMALSACLFVLVPLLAAWGVRSCLSVATREALEARLKPATMVALVLTIVVVFTIQGERLANNLLDVVLVAVPLTIQTYFIFGLTYLVMQWLRVPFQLAAPGALIAASNFFELAVAVAVSLYGAQSGAVLATVVGVLTEVPIMLSLCWIANNTSNWFPQLSAAQAELVDGAASQPAEGAATAVKAPAGETAVGDGAEGKSPSSAARV